MFEQEPPDLVAVSILSMKPEPIFDYDFVQAQSAKIQLSSTVRELNDRFQTGPLGVELVKCCELLRLHGFTVVEAPENWRFGGWQNRVFRKALERVASIYQDGEPKKRMKGYNEELADAVLQKLNEIFPSQMHMHTLKNALGEPEPSDDELGGALQALHVDGLIEGRPLYESMSGDRKLVAMAQVQISKNGRAKLSGQMNKSDPSGTIVQGDQYNSFGITGAMGKDATGTIQYQQHWNQLSEHINSQRLVAELELLREALQKRASTREHHRQLGLIAEAEEQAEKQDGSKVMETLSKLGKGAFDLAKEIGTEVAAKALSKAMALEP